MTADIRPDIEFVEDEEEDEELSQLSPEEISQAVLYTTDWTTETILSQITGGNIDLSPRFQRRDAWTPSRKSRFIESLFLSLPVPQIVLAEQKASRGKYIVIDGKQRLLTLLQFAGRAEGKNNELKLTGLSIRGDLNGRKLQDIGEDLLLASDLAAYNNQPIRTIVIRNWPSIEFLHAIFVRLNTSSVPLSPQELRQALLPGGFVYFIDDAASESKNIQRLLGNNEPDFRMRDVELLLRFMAFKLFLNDYAGNLRAFLDDACKRLNREWDNRAGDTQSCLNQIEEAITATFDIFGDEGIGRKWIPDSFERRLNRAVLDVQVFYFSDERIRKVAIKKEKKVRQAFQNLCITNEVFRTSIETTTKSLGATYTRLREWGHVLSGALALDFQLPRWIEETNRIDFGGFWLNE